jgi:hypothetical protein
MDTLRSLMELYGAFDHALFEDDNPDLASTVDRLFPGSSSNRGWYSELERFFFSETATGPRLRPDPTEALDRIVSASRENGSPSLVQQSQILYGLLALNQVQHDAPTTALPDLPALSAAFGAAFELFTPVSLSSSGPATTREPTADQATARQTTAYQAPADQAAAYQAPGDDAGADESATAEKTLESLLDEIASMFDSRAAWREVVAFAVQQLNFDEKIVEVPLCEAALATIDGTPCVVVDTEFTSQDVTFKQVLDVVNPYNWHLNYPDFFCGMTGSGPNRSDGWGRVLERVSFCGWEGVRGLSTALKYYPKKLNETYACLDYDLDDPTPGPGDGQVTVDRGYINVASTSGSATTKGVRVNTRKVVHITGVLPYAQARLVCITGYGASSMQFICGAAEIQPPRPNAFEYPGPGVLSNNSPAAKPANAVPTAVKVWTQMLQDVTNSYLELAEKWTGGGLTIQDLTDYSTQVGGRLASTPWQILQAVVQPGPPATNPNQGQGGGA